MMPMYIHGDYTAAAAAVCVQRKGAIPSLPTREEVDLVLGG